MFAPEDRRPFHCLLINKAAEMDGSSHYALPLPALDEFCFASDIETGPSRSDAQNCTDTAAAKTKNEEVERGKKRGSSFISEDDDGSQSSANKEAVHVYFDLIDKAEAEKRIDAKKASRLRACINSDDIIRALLCEQIPDKRPGNGYVCRVCKVPLKGHCCPYCPVCSTPKDKIKKNDSHTCKNCIKCFDEGKKRKKLVQLSKDKCTCKVRGTKS